MSSFLKKCRGVLGIAVAWGAAWGALLAALSIVTGIVDPDSIDPGEGPLAMFRMGAIIGFLTGTGFAVLLSP